MQPNSFNPDTQVRLGDFVFQDTEVPEEMPFGAQQILAEHNLPGGFRVIDSMGGFSRPIEWSGLFRGPDALARARRLDTMARDGSTLTLTWSELSYEVVIETFDANFQRFYQIPYRIVCVVADGSDAPAASADSLDGQMRSDMDSLTSMSDSIGDGLLSSSVSTLGSAISSVSDFAKAAQSTINSVLSPLAAVQSQVSTLITSVSNTVINVSSLGGVLPNAQIAQQATKLLGQVSAFTSLPTLYGMQSVLGRMGTNLGNANTTGQTVSMAGGNLYQVAASEYGDATAWPLIAKANGIIDPQITGVKTIVIPPAPATDQPVGGILNG